MSNNTNQYKRVDTVLRLKKSLEKEFNEPKETYAIQLSYSPKDQDEILKLLNNVRNHKSYYVGGSLCIDCVINGKEDVLVLNLDETYGLFSGGARALLSIPNAVKLFDVYKKVKGETGYFRECMREASIRHIYDLRTEFKTN